MATIGDNFIDYEIDDGISVRIDKSKLSEKILKKNPGPLVATVLVLVLSALERVAEEQDEPGSTHEAISA